MQKIPGYQIIRKINQGGMSTVYLAVQLSVGREVALKVMSPALNADPVFSERFQREANIVGQLTHPNIVSIYDIGRHNNLNYIAMDYLPGGSIHDRMTSGISMQECLRITKEIAGALDHAHRKGYVHRDIKPENILFNEENTAILSDFGVAKTVSSGSQMTNAGTVVGTPHYMSPEQARGKPIDGRSDLYSLGVVLFEMLTGSVPFKAEEAVAIAIKHLTAPIPKLPSQYSLLQPIVNKLLAKEPEDRFQCGRELIAALDNTQNHLSGRTTVYTTTTDSSALQILALLKALLLTIYAAVSGEISKVGKWLFGWRWSSQGGLYHASKFAEAQQPQDDFQTTVVSTPLNDAVVVTRHGQARRPNTLLVVLFALLSLWLASSSLIHSTESAFKQHLPKPLYSATQFTHEQLRQLFSSQTPDEDSDAITPNTKTKDSVQLASQPATATAAAAQATPDTPADPATEAATSSLPPTTPVEPPKPTHFELTVTPKPANARVRIMNIKEKYSPGILLEPGKYNIRVSARGYDTQDKVIEIVDSPMDISLALRKSPVPGTLFYNTLASGGKGPGMVIIPPGRFSMGNTQSSDSAPVRTVKIKRAFAVSRYEVTFADYRKFSRATQSPMPKSSGWGHGSRPVINVSWNDAKAYTEWLRQSTGKKYRLLSEAEWEYVARAGTSTDYWWPKDNAKGLANCRRGCDSQYSGLFSTKTAPVGSFKPNPFKVFDTSGNVAEWVEDCYQGHYLGAPRTPAALTSSNCLQRSLRGGSIKSAAKDITTHSRDKMPPETKANNIGFRVAVDLY